MNDSEDKRAIRTFNEIAGAIAGRRLRLADMAHRCDGRMTVMKQAHSEASRRKMSDWWTLVAYQSAYIKLRLMVEQHFLDEPSRNKIFGDTIGLLAAARYAFELIVWLKTLQNDPNKGLLFRLRTVTNDLQHHRGARVQMTREIAQFRSFAQEEARLLAANLRDSNNRSKDEIVIAAEQISEDIDREARSRFSIYARQAQETSYDLQAGFLQTEAVPRVSAQILELEAEEAELLRLLTLPNAPGWKWNQKAEAVGMKDQYEFFYRYASRLMHAEPVSFATHQPDLENYEIAALLDYILASIDVAAALGRTVLKRFPLPPGG
jgi:hypothetical protein